MSLSIYGNFSIPSSVSAMSLALTTQSHELLNDSSIDYSVKGNRLHKNRDGSLEVIPKTPFEIFGERIIRPLIDTTYDFSSRTFQVLKSGFSFLDNIFSRTLIFLPVAKASQSIDDQSIVTEESDKTLKVYTQPPCDALLALNKALNDYQENSGQIAPSEAVVALEEESARTICLHSEDFHDDNTVTLTPQQAKDELEKIMKRKILIPQMNCLAEASIRMISNIKKPSLAQKQALQEAYAELQQLTNGENLAGCFQRLLELFGEIYSETRAYSIDALAPLPELLATLLSKSGTGFTFSQLDLLVTKVNEISRKMITELQRTNEKKAVFRWIDVMLESAEKNIKNTNLLVSTIIVANEVLQGNMGDVLKREQEKKLRKIARWLKNSPITQQEQAIAINILAITDPQTWGSKYFYHLLESLPDDIEKFDGVVQDILSTLYKSLSFKISSIGILTSCLTVFLFLKYKKRHQNQQLVQ
jgi:hypothetical protein